MGERPIAINREIPFPDGEFIVSKTDLKGVITYGNEVFIQMSGYSEEQLLGAAHNILRHPDMPRLVFKLLWDTIQKGDEIFAFVKNLAKDGSYYWVKSQVTPSVDTNGKIIGYHSVRRKPSRDAVKLFDGLYKVLLEEEVRGGIDASLRKLNEILAQKGVTYEQLVFAL